LHFRNTIQRVIAAYGPEFHTPDRGILVDQFLRVILNYPLDVLIHTDPK
jgi:hypothetical protein